MITFLGHEVRECDFKDSTLKRVSADFISLGLIDGGPATITDVEEVRRLDNVPLLLGEGMVDLLLESFLFEVLLVLSCGHFLKLRTVSLYK